MSVNDRLHVLLPTDVFPPIAGGAGWSAHALATALQARGHRVTAIVPRRGTVGTQRREEDGVPVIDVGYPAPNIPFVQNYYRFELLWPLLRNVLVATAYRERDRSVVIHAQHAQTAPAAVLAARELNVPALATIRDAWPWHYFATGLLGDRLPFERQNWGTAWLDLLGRLGPIKGMLAAPAVPYMRRHLARRAHLLAEADAVIACSQYIRDKLQPIVAKDRLHVIPNLIDVEVTKQIAAQRPPLAGVEDHAPFVLFVGKLQRNKGAHLLAEVMSIARERGAQLPRLVIAGNGELEAELRAELAARSIDHGVLAGWTPHNTVLHLMQRAEVLLFPSAWGEPLSRVLLEGCAVGACIAAIDTGGTSDIIEHDTNGVLARDAQELGYALAALLSDPERRQRLRQGAAQIAQQRFAASVVVEQVEQLYYTVLGERTTARPPTNSF